MMGDNLIEQSHQLSQMYCLRRDGILPPSGECALEATRRTGGKKRRWQNCATSCLNNNRRISTPLFGCNAPTRTKINRTATTSTSSAPVNTEPAIENTSSLVRKGQLSSASSPPIVIGGLILIALLTQPNGTLCKGLVGKLPGNPASCPEEPCTSDPQHVLYALKWTSLGFGIILLLPLLMYYLSKLISKIHSMCSNKKHMEAKQTGEKEQQEQKQAGGSTRSNRSATSGAGRASKHGSEPASMASSASSAAGASSLASATTKEPPAEMSQQQQHQIENKKSFGSGEAGGHHDRRRKSTLIENNLEREARHSMVQRHHLYQRNLEASQRRSSALPTFDKFQLEESMQLNQDLEQRNRQLVQMIADSNAIIQQRANINSNNNNNNDQERGSGSGSGKRGKNQHQHRYSMIPAQHEHRMSNQYQQNQNEAKLSTASIEHRHSLKARPGSSRRLMQNQHHQRQHQIYPEQLGATGLQEQHQDHHEGNPWIEANRNTASSPPSSSNSTTNQFAAKDGKLSLVGHLYQQQQQQQQQQHQHDQNTLALPANGAQHRHSIDGSILNNMVHGMQQGREQVNSVSSGSGSGSGSGNSDIKHHHHRQEQRGSYSPNTTSGGDSASHGPGSRKKQQQQQHLAYQQQQHYLNNYTQNHNNGHNQLLIADEPNRNRRPSLNETTSMLN